MDFELESMWGAMKGVHYQRTIEQLTRIIQDTEQLQGSFDETLEAVRQATRAEAVVFWFYDRYRDGRIKPVAAVGGAELSGVSIKLGEDIQGRVIRTGEPVLVEDCRKDPSWAGKPDKALGRPPRTMLCVPLIFADDVYGCMQLADRMGNLPGFDQTDLHFAEEIAGAAVELFLKNGYLDPYLDLYANPVPNFADVSIKQLLTSSSEYELERTMRRLTPFTKLSSEDQAAVLGLCRQIYRCFKGTENKRKLGFGRP